MEIGHGTRLVLYSVVAFESMTDNVTLNRKGTWWTLGGRILAFLLASSSIACLLADFYGLCPMHVFTPFIFIPALAILASLAVVDGRCSDGQLCRAVVIGVVGGLLAAVAYDVFRLPFVFSREWGLASVVPSLNLYKSFPRFGAMILGQPLEQGSYSTAASLFGWAYHFSNGATFGVMYLAMVGDARRRHWAWAILFAVGLELGMLFTPYPRVFGIPVTANFVIITMAAHAIFGACLGLSVKWLADKQDGAVLDSLANDRM